MRAAVLPLLIALLLCAASCGRSAQLPSDPGAAAGPATLTQVVTDLHLPPLDELKEQVGPRRTSYLPADLIAQGEDFLPNQPHFNVIANASGVLFSPQAPQSGLSGSAYCLLHFSVGDYAGNPRFTFDWNSQPQRAGDVTILLANWTTQRYESMHPGTIDTLILPTVTPYIRGDGSILMAVMLRGSSSAELDFVRLGSLPPQAALSADPAFGLVPVTVTLDASASFDTDGSIAEYRWDPEGDGSFDVSTGSTAQLSFDYTSAGDFHPAVRVFDDKHVYGEASTGALAADSKIFSAGAPVYFELATAAVPLADGHVMLFGFGDNGPRISFISRVSPQGSLDFARSWGSDTDWLEDAALGPDGFIYACGVTYSQGPGGNGDGNGILQKWSQDGELIWSRAIGQIGIEETFYGITLTSSAIYVCGKLRGAAPQDICLIASFDYEANQVWAQTVIGPSSSELRDIAYFSTSVIGGDDAVIACGDYYDNNSGDALVTFFDTSGNNTLTELWGGPSSVESANSIVVTGKFLPQVYVTGSQTIIASATSSNSAFISRVGTSTVLIDVPGSSLRGHALMTGGLGTVTVSMERDSFPGATVLAGLDSNLALTAQREITAVPDGSCNPLCFASYGADAILVCGNCFDQLPSESSISLTLTPSAEAWRSITTPVGSPNMSTTNEATDTSTVSGAAINRQAGDDDMFFCLTRP